MNSLFRKSIFSLILVILMLVISSCSQVLSQPTTQFTPGPPIETPIPSLTPTASNTSTPSFTPSPRPTNTPTPQPGWVTDFAQPILDAIADRTPSFQDDFGPGSTGWDKDYCVGSMKYIDGELVITNCRVFRPNTDWRDLALEVDMHFIKGTGSSTE
jgi:hypothetical protein